jgi:hypothetical protein
MAASETVRLLWENLISVMRNAHRYLEMRMETSDPLVDRQECVRLMAVGETLTSWVMLSRPLAGETEAEQLAKLRIVESVVEDHSNRVEFV